MSRAHRAVFWERVDAPGCEAVVVDRGAAGWEIEGRYVGREGGEPVAADFRLLLDPSWVALRLDAAWGLGLSRKTVAIDRVGTRWRVDGEQRPDLDGCIDLDVEWTPLTNTLPIRRMAPPAGEPRLVHAAWLRAGTLAVEPSLQRYTRLDDRRVRFEGVASGFSAELEVDEDGLVVSYAGLFRRPA